MTSEVATNPCTTVEERPLQGRVRMMNWFGLQPLRSTSRKTGLRVLARQARLHNGILRDIGFQRAERQIARPAIRRQLPLAVALPCANPQILTALFTALARSAGNQSFAA